TPLPSSRRKAINYKIGSPVIRRKMPKLLKTILQFTGFLGIGILLIWLVTRNLTPAQVEEIRDALRRADYWILLPAAVLGFLSHWVRAMRWRLLFLPLGYQPRKLNTFFAV